MLHQIVLTPLRHSPIACNGMFPGWKPMVGEEGEREYVRDKRKWTTLEAHLETYLLGPEIDLGSFHSITVLFLCLHCFNARVIPLVVIMQSQCSLWDQRHCFRGQIAGLPNCRISQHSRSVEMWRRAAFLYLHQKYRESAELHISCELLLFIALHQW